MKVDIPYYNYTKKQLDELEEIVNQFTWEFDTTETRKQLNSIIRDKDFRKTQFTNCSHFIM